jgi:hypothetical protein
MLFVDRAVLLRPLIPETGVTGIERRSLLQLVNLPPEEVFACAAACRLAWWHATTTSCWSAASIAS